MVSCSLLTLKKCEEPSYITWKLKKRLNIYRTFIMHKTEDTQINTILFKIFTYCKILITTMQIWWTVFALDPFSYKPNRQGRVQNLVALRTFYEPISCVDYFKWWMFCEENRIPSVLEDTFISPNLTFIERKSSICPIWKAYLSFDSYHAEGNYMKFFFSLSEK